jgi:hypothetical protein
MNDQEKIIETHGTEWALWSCFSYGSLSYFITKKGEKLMSYRHKSDARRGLKLRMNR